jgi:hypothetical protein
MSSNELTTKPDTVPSVTAFRTTSPQKEYGYRDGQLLMVAESGVFNIRRGHPRRWPQVFCDVICDVTVRL